MAKERNICARCGADRKETRRLGNNGCSAWGRSWYGHMWKW